jgi:hypothetical protein
MIGQNRGIAISLLALGTLTLLVGALSVGSVAARGGGKTYFVDERGAKVRPSTIAIGSQASFQPRFLKLRPWRHWGQSRTNARGKYRYNTCKPTCASQNYKRIPVKVRLSHQRHSCGRRNVYKQLTYKVRNPSISDGTVNVNCHGIITY